MRTILQKIGPLYGEDVNGTVFGQPNGSEYIPPKNVLDILNVNTDVVGIKKLSDNKLVTCTADGTQTKYADLSIYSQVDFKLEYELSEDSDFSTHLIRGMDTTHRAIIPIEQIGIYLQTLTADKEYYLRYTLHPWNDSQTVMAQTEPITFKGVV